MDPRFECLLGRCCIAEKQFLNGVPAVFDLKCRPSFWPITIIALYEDGKVIVEATSFPTLHQRSQGHEPELGPIVVGDLNKIQATIDYIAGNAIQTRPAYLEGVNPEYDDKKLYAIEMWTRRDDEIPIGPGIAYAKEKYPELWME